MKELELKAVLDDWDARRAAAERAGARLEFAGRLEDRRYDTPTRQLTAADHVLRTRAYVGADGTRRAELDWKGPTRFEDGYKMREEIGTPAGDPRALAEILARLGYVVTVTIDREIVQFALAGATVRFERYPRMDDLVEVEGAPAEIERAIAALGMPRDAFTSERLSAFVARWEARTGVAASLGGAPAAPRPGDL